MSRPSRVLILLLAYALILTAQATEVSTAALQQAQLDLGTDLRLMCVAAHPDDEDGATLAHYRKRFGMKTFAVIATRGEGGQNEIGPELYEALGVIRTREMMAASAITGAELHFLNLPEFGYSKTREETYAVWGEEETVRRLVRVIRLTKPDVIITHHGIMKDHGHHQAIGHALQIAFDHAGDPASFPELADEGLDPWQPARLYVRNKSDAPNVIVNNGLLHPASGKTYIEIASDALRTHKSQGMAAFIDNFLKARTLNPYELIKERPRAKTGGVPAPEGAVLFEGLSDRIIVDTREADARDAIAKGLRLTLNTSDTAAVRGQTITLTAHLEDFGDLDLTKADIALTTEDWLPAAIQSSRQTVYLQDRQANVEFKLTIPQEQTPTLPQPRYLFNPHFLTPQLQTTVTAESKGEPISLSESLYLDIAPSATLEFLDAPYLIHDPEQRVRTITVAVTNHYNGPQNLTITFSPTPGLTLAEEQITLHFDAERDQKVIPLAVELAPDLDPRALHITGRIAESDYAETATLQYAPLEVPRDLNIGVIQSYDDTYVHTLDRLGVPHKALQLEDFTADALAQYGIIIIDIRAYLVRKDLVANNAMILEYVHNGGTLIVNYQKTFDWKPEFAPYPITISRNRVTREDAAITLLQPQHPLFTTPNAINPINWTGWRQERGLYFPNAWDDAYTPLIACNDPDEDIPPGSALVAKYGNGLYLYTALGWYRQLRELHPGALKVFANMLALKGECV